MYSGGSGTRNDPYLIGTKADIELMFQNGEDEAYYKQIADIDMLGAEYSWQSGYKGAYDGQNYKISNVSFGSGFRAGFFGGVYKMADFDGDAQIKNVRLVTISVSDDSYCGCFAGSLSGVTVQNCHVESGEVTSLDGIGFPNYAGGFAGSVNESQILDCSFSGAIEAGYNSAGFVGFCWDSVISNCIVNASVKHNDSQTAGLVSYLSHDSIVEKCKVQVIFEEIPGTWYSVRIGGIAVECNGYIGQCTCNISINGNRSGYFGGIAATMTAREWWEEQYNPVVENCYVRYTDTVFTNDDKRVYIGGIAAHVDVQDNCNATIRNCYVSGSIKIEIPENMYINNEVVVGGLVAYITQNSGGTITLDNCFSSLDKIEIYSPGSYTTDQIGRIWVQIDDEKLPFLTSTCYANAGMLYNSGTTFPNEDKTLGGKDGEDIATTALREKETYTSRGWDFNTIWGAVPFYNDGLPYLRCFGDLAYTEKNNFIKIYDSDCDPDMQLLAVVAKVIDPTISEELNGEYTFDFSYVIDDEKSQHMQVGNIVEAEGNYFRIAYTEETRNDDDTMTISVSCEHVVYDLIEQELDYYTADGTATQMLQALLTDTAFTVGDVDTSEVKTVSIQEKQNKKDILYAVASVFGLELRFDKFVISLVTRGSDNGVQFRYRRNIKGITRIVDGRNKVEGQPSIAYGLDAVMLEQLFGDSEHFELGDVITAYDEGLGIDVTTRIVRMRYDIEERMTADVEIANYIPNISDTLTQIERTTVHKEKIYNGVKIGPDDGIVVERSDKLARNTMNATYGNKLELGDGEGNYTPVFYVTIENDEAKLNLKGNAEFTGKVLASLISASDVKGGSIEIGDNMFTVDNTGHMIANSAYIQGLIEASEFIGGKIIITNEAETERVILSVLGGFRFQAWDENAGTEGEWIDNIWMEDGKGKFFGEIISSIITGGTIRTAAEGKRIEISNNQIHCYNNSNKLQGMVTNNETTRFGDFEFYDDDTMVFRIYNGLLGQGVTLRPENGASLRVGLGGSILGLRGYIKLNGQTIPSFDQKTAGAVYGTNEQEMLQETHDMLRQLLDAINDN